MIAAFQPVFALRYTLGSTSIGDRAMSAARLHLSSVLAVVLLLPLVSCIQSDLSEPRAIVDLSPTIREGLPTEMLGKRIAQRLWKRDVVIDNFGIEEPIYVQMSYVTIATYVGSHVDPPNHMIKDSKGADELSLEKFFGRAKVFDFRDKPKDTPLLVPDFEGKGIEAGDIVIAFVGYVPPSDPDEFPSYSYLSDEAAEYLANIPIKAFASDMPSLGSIRLAVELRERE
jgi:kynurenine formamidase